MRRRELLRGAGATLAAGALAGVASGQTGVSAAWRFDTGGKATPATVVGETAFVCAGAGRLFAVDVADGTRRWAFPTDSGQGFAPNVADGTVYVTSRDGTLHAVDAVTGEARWGYGDAGTVLGSPTAEDGRVHFLSQDGTLHAVGADDGVRLWTASVESFAGAATPAVADGSVYAAVGEGLYAVDAASGERRWQRSLASRRHPTVANGTVYLGGAAPEVYAVDAATGEDEWLFQASGSFYSTPTAFDGSVYIGSDDGSLYAIDAASGQQRWRFTTDGEMNTSPTALGDVVLVTSEDGYLYAVDAASGERRWRFTPEGHSTDPDIPFEHSSPTVADGVVYAGFGADLVAVEAPLQGDSEGSRVRLETLGHVEPGPLDGGGSPTPEPSGQQKPESTAEAESTEGGSDPGGNQFAPGVPLNTETVALAVGGAAALGAGAVGAGWLTGGNLGASLPGSLTGSPTGSESAGRPTGRAGPEETPEASDGTDDPGEESEEEDGDDDDDDDDDDSAVEIVQEVDPLSAASWATQPVMARVEARYDDVAVEYQPAPVRRFDDPAVARESWASVAEGTGMPVAPGFWAEHAPDSTGLVNRAFAAAREQDAGRAYLRAVWRHAVAGGEPVDEAALVGLAASVGLDTDRFREDLASARVSTGGQRTALPFTIVEVHDVPVPLTGPVEYDELRTQLTAQGLVEGRPPELEAFLDDHGPVAAAEVAAVYGIDREAAVERLERGGFEAVERGGERFWTDD